MVDNSCKDGARSVSKMKKTEIGVIPEDWEVKKLKELCVEMLQGINTAIDKPEYSIDGYPILKANDIIDGNIDLNIAEYISEKSFNSYSPRFYIKKNDFLLSNIGARLGSGSIYKYDTPSTFAWNVMKLRPDKEIIDSLYFSIFLNSDLFFTQMINNQSGSGMGFVPKATLENFDIILPPLPEQEAIATALSDADAWIERLEQLIAKKRLIKQGAMQELLTPKEDWEEQSIISICDNIIDYRGVTPKKLGMEWGDGDIVALSAGNVKKGYIDFNADCYLGSEVLYKRWMRNGDPKKGDIVFTLEAPLGNIALIPDDKKYILSQRTILLQLNQKYSSKYIFQLMLSSKFQNFISESATGSTAQGIKRQTFEKLIIHVPSFSDQERIATILSDMDAELEVLEKQLGKAQQIKQGMMQELLTGRVRLV